MARQGITLQIARQHLAEWLKAELILTEGGQSYQMGSRMLTRASLREIRNEIKFWHDKVQEFELIKKHGGRNRVIRAVPRDL
ncbi:MAG: DUF6148 family protein [Defluviitaleaceae bacterium]|nr:DUF6148 family protein [Defluviitaleaceae bacterium]